MEDNKPRYIVTLSDGNAFQLTEQEYKSREDAIFGKDKGATVARINDYSIDDDIDDNAAYTVTSGDNTFLLSADEYKSRRDKIRGMDGVRVGSLSHIDYWGDKLKAINDDFVAWLYFPYFDISYPVVQETEIDEYLKKTFDGTRNIAGCLFTDILSSADFCGMHDIIFGHNMRNGSMFGKLKKLSQTEDRNLIKENPYIYVYTEKAVFKYEIFAYYITTVGSDAYSVVTTDDEYDDFLKYIATNSVYDMPADLDMSSHPSILTLSTCSGRSGSGRRFVIHAAKTETWEQ